MALRNFKKKILQNIKKFFELSKYYKRLQIIMHQLHNGFALEEVQ